MKATLSSLSLVLALLLAACGGTPESPAASGTEGTVPIGATGTVGGPSTVPIQPEGTGGAEAIGTATADAGAGDAGAGDETPQAGATGTAGVGAAVGGPVAGTSTAGPTKRVKVSVMYNGTLGDKGFFDSAQAGVQRAVKELNAELVTEVAEPTQANWIPTLQQLAEGDAEVIVLGTFQMVDAITEVAKEFPDKKFILYDATTEKPIPNVASILYAQNEGSFLAGVVAACAATSDLEGVTGEKVIGAVGGDNVDVINDFIVGYEQGAKYFDAEMEVRKAYNSGPQAYEDPVKGKALASDLFADGASVVFQVAGKTGLGVLEAAKEEGRYAIGVDSNQNNLEGSEGAVLTSMLKRVDNSVFDLIRREATGGLETGKTYTYGLQNEGVGLAEDAVYERLVPEKCKQQVERARREITSGKVEVRSAFGQ